MRRFTFRLIVALLTFIVGVAASWLWIKVHHSSPAKVNFEEGFSFTLVATKPQRTYERGPSAGKAMSKNGVPASFSGFSSSDGMKFFRWSEYHDSPIAANKELQRTLRKAKEIIKREPLLDRNGMQVGEKIIAIFPPKYLYYGAATFLWTDGSTFGYISSSSLQNILEYEKDSNR
jgi:hypothetical protein